MKILLTGATGYIGKRLLPVLLENGHEVVCGVRDKARFTPPERFAEQVVVVEMDLLEKDTLHNIPTDIDAAYYLIHSMSSASDYAQLELRSAENFRAAMEHTKVKQVIYLSGIINEEDLSEHLASRKAVEVELSKGNYHSTTLRAGIIIGSGSASFEIIRDLAEKLPVMITPKWLTTKCQPIGVADVIQFLERSLGNENTYDRNFDIGGPDVLTYKEMLLGYAKVRGLKRWIFIVPVMTPRLSSYWLYFITSTSYRLAIALVNSMKVEVIARNDKIDHVLGITPIGYEEALHKTLSAIESEHLPSSWKDAMASGGSSYQVSEFVRVPTHGCFVDTRTRPVNDELNCIQRIWRIGGTTGWYNANILWKLRGFIDKLVGGVGLRRGRTHPEKINPGDTIDFWRVLVADREAGRLLLFAEMKLPGEAWLEFHVHHGELHQTATFRPKGLWGRLYWYAVYPFHGLVFSGMIKKLAE